MQPSKSILCLIYPLFKMTNCDLPFKGINAQFSVPCFWSGIYAHTCKVTKSGGRCLCCLHSVSLSHPLPAPAWVLCRKPQTQWWGWDKPTTAHRLRSDEDWGRRHLSFGGLGLIASSCKGLNSPHMECGPSNTHALRHGEEGWGWKRKK